MPEIVVDFYLGSDIGLWVLNEVSPKLINFVITRDQTIAESAEGLGIATILNNPNQIEFSNASIGVSVHYPIILKPHVIVRYKKMYNLHPAYLPWGRGFYPIFWALWEGTPAGATLHEITEGVDEGPIVLQRQVLYTDADTGYDLFERVRQVEKEIFRDFWLKLQSGDKLAAYSQEGVGNYHSKKDFLSIQNTDEWTNWSAQKLLKLVKCLSFPGYPGLIINLADRKFSLKLEQIDET